MDGSQEIRVSKTRYVCSAVVAYLVLAQVVLIYLEGGGPDYSLQAFIAPFLIPFVGMFMFFTDRLVYGPFLIGVLLGVLAVKFRWRLSGWFALVGSLLAFLAGGAYAAMMIASF